MQARTFKRIACLCSIVPISVVCLGAFWSMQTGLAAACFPLLEGCTSISGSVRERPVIWLFRAVMLPMSLILFVFWWLNSRFLTECLPQKKVLRQSIMWLSLVGTAFLPLYVLYLGTHGPVYEFLRRLGIYVFFGATGIAQLLTTLALRFEGRSGSGSCISFSRANTVIQLQLLIVLIMLLAGPLNLVLKQILNDSRHIENIIEWNFGLLMFSWYCLQGIVYARYVDADGPQGNRTQS